MRIIARARIAKELFIALTDTGYRGFIDTRAGRFVPFGKRRITVREEFTKRNKNQK